MMTYTPEQLTEILAKHKAWLNNEEGGERAYLSGAYLSGADLSRADLSGAYLSGASGNMAEIKSVQADIWPVTYTAEVMQIGCQRHSIAEWWAFNDIEIGAMDSDALTWWGVWKPILQTIIAASPAVPINASNEGDAA